MGSNPIIGTSKDVVVLGKMSGFEILSIANSRARKRTETLYPSSIRQVRASIQAAISDDAGDALL